MQVQEITERYHLGRVVSSTRWMRSLRAIDRATGEAVVFELVPRATEPGGGDAVAEDRRRRFLDGAAILSELRHPSLPAFLDHGVTPDGDLYLVREADVGRSLATLGGESPVELLALLLQAVEALELMAEYRLHHGWLSLENLRVVPGADGRRCRIVGFAAGLAGLADGALQGVDAERLQRIDVRSLAAVTSRLLGATITDPDAPRPEVRMALAASFELEDVEALRRLLERGLRLDADDETVSYQEIRDTFGLALWGGGEPVAPEAAAASVATIPTAPPVRLTFTSEPPDEGALVSVDSGAPTRPASSDDVTSVVLAEDVPARGELAEALAEAKRDPAAEPAADVAARLEETHPACEPGDSEPDTPETIPNPSEPAAPAPPAPRVGVAGAARRRSWYDRLFRG